MSEKHPDQIITLLDEACGKDGRGILQNEVRAEHDGATICSRACQKYEVPVKSYVGVSGLACGQMGALIHKHPRLTSFPVTAGEGFISCRWPPKPSSPSQPFENV